MVNPNSNGQIKINFSTKIVNKKIATGHFSTFMLGLKMVRRPSVLQCELNPETKLVWRMWTMD